MQGHPKEDQPNKVALSTEIGKVVRIKQEVPTDASLPSALNANNDHMEDQSVDLFR